LGSGTSVGEMAYLAPSPDLRIHSADILVSQPATTVTFTPDSLRQLSLTTRHLCAAFIRVLVRRLHAAHEALHHPRGIFCRRGARACWLWRPDNGIALSGHEEPEADVGIERLVLHRYRPQVLWRSPL